jgi:hypothetical protein
MLESEFEFKTDMNCESAHTYRHNMKPILNTSNLKQNLNLNVSQHMDENV